MMHCALPLALYKYIDTQSVLGAALKFNVFFEVACFIPIYPYHVNSYCNCRPSELVCSDTTPNAQDLKDLS